MRFLWLLLLVLLAAGLVGCGGAGNSLPPLPVFVAGSVTPDERYAAYDEVEAFFETVRGQPDATAQVVAKMKSMPQFATAEVAQSGQAVGWFKDGQMYVVFTVDEGGSSPAPHPPVHLRPKSHDLPAGTTAYVINAFEPARPDASAVIGPELAAKGYNVELLSGTVSDYKSISNASLLFVHAHGVLETDRYRVPRFWYATSETPSAGSDDLYSQYYGKAEIAVGSVYTVEADGSTGLARIYCINDHFLHDVGITFAQNAFWMSQSCDSYNSVMLKVLDPVAGFPGVKTYAGWTLEELSADSTPTSLFVFDRLLGVDQVDPIEPGNPPPYDFGKLTDMLSSSIRPNSSLPYSASDGTEGRSVFTIKTAPGSDSPTIIPSVASVNLNAGTHVVTIGGHFGKPQGSVTLNGDFLNVQSWSETSIKVDQPTADSGTLLVRSLGGPSDGGYLLSNSYPYQSLGIEIQAPNVSVDPLSSETLTAVATAGVIPPGVSYKWSVTGLGTLNGSSHVTTTTPNVTYKAPSQDSSDVISVQVLDSHQTILAVAQITIDTATNPSLHLVISGNWDALTQGILGTYNFSPGNGVRATISGLDYIFFEYDSFPNTNGTGYGVTFTLGMPVGQAVTQGEQFTLADNGQLTAAGQFKLLLDTDLNDPANGGNFNPQAASGTLTINSVQQQQDGSYLAHYSFTLSSALGGTITGTGVGTWR